MAATNNITVLDADPTGVEFRCALHIAIPAGNNSAGVPWSTALLNSGISSGVSQLKAGDGTAGTCSSADATAIAAGTLYEYIVTMRVDSFAGGATELTNEFTALKNAKLTELQARLKWFGKAG